MIAMISHVTWNISCSFPRHGPSRRARWPDSLLVEVDS